VIRRLLSMILPNARARRWASVRHLDANAAARRRVIAQNRAEVLAKLRGQK
jgi:hypothetical protein